jgi:hypothetical protein
MKRCTSIKKFWAKARKIPLGLSGLVSDCGRECKRKRSKIQCMQGHAHVDKLPWNTKFSTELSEVNMVQTV